MFYRPEDGHGLPHNPFNAIVSPRPIGWISTRGPEGDNLAPYSFFNAVAYVPPQVMFASTGAKDSLAALRASGVFCVNIVEEAALARMNATSAAFPRGTDEFLAADVPKDECRTIPCPRVADAPASLECRVTQVVELLGRDNFLILGEVTGVHLRDDCLRDGRFDVTAFRPMARLGYRDYAVVREVIELSRPGEG
ncbi:flavin reductase family protein [Cereibacter johrii]|uniref:Flavin reductase (DIM6/NTAB) family NADH-FMN oxidoreductase RutF n=1 Tax=Cereibacter johrii TaxID=445629 RepID=A0ABX5JFE9_9RHOB|nr:flavin reductase family protein [Cereibacter johrii]MEA5161845.1 flavin reductase family protein [Cereibacter johrii]ODM41799.1 flavin reductase [Cereibacter johrii]PTM81260.1 flavin reductase (DIM6/NTAB) family NADH-FMN oxidoreductase RutF [Cereibacter johrii]RDS95794.1 flavin reductase family protein [Cereibacter sphaeroides f. sp. denitrificans]